MMWTYCTSARRIRFGSHGGHLGTVPQCPLYFGRQPGNTRRHLWAMVGSGRFTVAIYRDKW
jgi:hypothetical protein